MVQGRRTRGGAGWLVAWAGLCVAGVAHAQEAEPAGDVATLYQPQSGGLTLADAMKRALEHAPALKKAAAETLRAHTVSNNTVFIFAPRIDLSGTYTRLSEVDLPQIPGGFQFPQFLNTYAFVAAAELAISDYFLSLPAFYRSSKFEYAAQVATEEGEKERVILETLEAYFTLLTARVAADVTEKDALALRNRAEDAVRLEEAGDITRAEAMSIKAQAASLERQALAARGQADLAMIRLRQLLGLKPDDPVRLGMDVFRHPKAPELNTEDAVVQAAEERPEIRALRHSIEQQRAEARRRLGEMLPKLKAGGQIDIANPNNRVFPLVNEFRETWQIFVGLSWSPNDFVAELTQRRAAQYTKQALEADLEGLRNTLELEVSTALSDWAVGRRAVEASQEEFEASEVAYKDQQVLFDLGESTAQDLLDREQAFREAALGRIRAAVDLHLARFRYDRALGQLDVTPAVEQ